MPATAKQEAVKEPSRASVSPEDWQAFFVHVDPLAAWKNQFAEWRGHIEQFRKVESAQFFADRGDSLTQHSHRGWLCSIISRGEMLAVELLQSQKGDAVDEFKFLNLCLENLQATLDTWHSTENASLESKRA